MFRKDHNPTKKLGMNKSIAENDYLHKKDFSLNVSRNVPSKAISPIKKMVLRRVSQVEDNYDSGLDINDKSMNFDEYKKEYNTMLKNYIQNTTSKTSAFNIKSINTASPEVSRLMIPNRNKSNNVENFFINTNVLEEDFHNPVESFIILESNKKLIEKVINSTTIRLKQRFLEENKKNKSFEGTANKKIKITNVVPKNLDLISVQEKNTCI